MRATSRRARSDRPPPARIEVDAEYLALKAQAEGRAVFVVSAFYDEIHRRVSEKPKEVWKLLPDVRLKFGVYMTARRLAESLKETVPA